MNFSAHFWPPKDTVSKSLLSRQADFVDSGIIGDGGLFTRDEILAPAFIERRWRFRNDVRQKLSTQKEKGYIFRGEIEKTTEAVIISKGDWRNRTER